jgi:hypothetical protein
LKEKQMREVKGFVLIAMLVLIALLAFGCSNADNNVLPPVPNQVDEPQGDVPDPFIPPPFLVPEDQGGSLGAVADIAFEKDGDMVFSSSNGLLLFDTFKQFKRNISDGTSGFDGLIDAGPGVLDSGRGVIASNPGDSCGWSSFYDDKYVTGGVFFPPPGIEWWGGEAHPPQGCSGTAASGVFSCDGNAPPRGIDIHPIYGWLFLKIANPKLAADGDCDLEPNPIPENWDLGDGIIAVHPMAPQNGFDPYHYEGTADFITYHNFTDVQGINSYGYPMIDAAIQIFVWDETNPFTMLPPRDGIETGNVTDFRFDAYGRLVMVLPNANSFAITDPVVPTQPIITQRIIGGANDGTSHNPGDFYGPRGVAIDPRNQDIYIADTGLNRVQVFDNQANFKRMFGAGISGDGLGFTAPTAIELDSFGNVYVVTSEGLQVFNEYGQPVSYGSIEGYVKDKSTSVPLDNVIVSVSSTYREFVTTTDEKGFFRFSSVPQGSHTLIANRNGYQAGNVNVSVDGGYKTTATIYMDRTGIGQSGVGDITGKMISSLDGDPLGGFLATIKGLGFSDTTNGNGEFHLYSVPEGDHVLQVLTGSTVVYETDVHVNSDTITPLGYIYLPF